MASLPSGIVARYCSTPSLYMDTVVVSAPKSTSIHPPLISPSLSAISASANGRMMYFESKLRRSLMTASILRKLRWLQWMMEY